MRKLKVFTDGGARGNPGPAAIGFIIIDEASGKILKKFGKRIGETTNNVAEYTAVIEALKWTRVNVSEETCLNFFLDSKLIVNQLNGFYKIKNPKLRNIIILVRQHEIESGGNIYYHYVPREKNKAADALVNFFLAQR